MPIYEYECECGKIIEALQRFTEDELTICNCSKKGKLRKIVSRSYFRLKGTCWSKDGYTKVQAVLRDKETGNEIKKSI